MAITNYTDIHGWFFWEDTLLFQDLLGSQTEPGTLVELGAFLGRSTALMGHYRRPGEDFVVVDLFGLEPDDVANADENTLSYSGVDEPGNFRQQFEDNYSAIHDEMPTIVQALSTEVAAHVGPGEVRFVHVDASHLYEHVAADIRTMRDLMGPNGIIVLDDYRAVHTPGVAAAAWEAVVNGGLIPFALSPFKMYATWGDPTELRERAWRLGEVETEMDVSRQSILGHDVVRLEQNNVPAPQATTLTRADLRNVSRRLAKDLVPQLREASRPTRSRSDWAPPVLVEWVRGRRKRRSAK